MKMRGRHRQLRGGITLVDLLVAALIMSIGIMALVNTWLFSFRVTTNTDDAAVAYSIGRYAMERVKMSGFVSAAEGSSTQYFSGTQASVSSNSSNRRFDVATSIVSDQVSSGTAGQAGAVPAEGALRTVTVTVRIYPSDRLLYQTNTYLVRAGI